MGFTTGNPATSCNSCSEMDMTTAKTDDLGKEKHVPVISIYKNIADVRVGSIDHPMSAEHYIEWIELRTDKKSYYKELKPGDEPAAAFVIGNDEHIRSAFAYCNIHGLWKKDMPGYIPSGCMGQPEDWFSKR